MDQLIVEAVLATGPRFTGSNPGVDDGFLWAIKILRTTSLGEEVKPSVPRSKNPGLCCLLRSVLTYQVVLPVHRTPSSRWLCQVVLLGTRSLKPSTTARESQAVHK
jgi:hypothetical protein